MTTPRTRIKVNREALIQKIADRHFAAVQQYDEDLVAYEKEAAAFPAKVAAYLTTLARAVRAGDITAEEALNAFGYHRRDYVAEPPSTPSKPSRVSDHYENAIAQLEIGVEEVVTITADDFARYLR